MITRYLCVCTGYGRTKVKVKKTTNNNTRKDLSPYVAKLGLCDWGLQLSEPSPGSQWLSYTCFLLTLTLFAASVDHPLHSAKKMVRNCYVYATLDIDPGHHLPLRFDNYSQKSYAHTYSLQLPGGFLLFLSV